MITKMGRISLGLKGIRSAKEEGEVGSYIFGTLLTLLLSSVWIFS